MHLVSPNQLMQEHYLYNILSDVNWRRITNIEYFVIKHILTSTLAVILFFVVSSLGERGGGMS